jgi:hypothetical protein
LETGRAEVKYVRSVAVSLIGVALASCATTAHLSTDANLLRDRMTPPQAESLLAMYSRPDATHGGLCLIGIRISLTKLDYSKLVDISGSVINFHAYYAAISNISVQGNVAAGTGRVGIAYKESQGASAIDVRTLREIRVLETKPQTLALCPNFKPGYLVALTTERGLPDQAQISLNAANSAELDSILAMLTFFSPNAKLVSGVGM